MKIVFLDVSTIGEVPNMDEIKCLGEYAGYSFTANEQRIERLAGADVAITNKVVIDRETMTACPCLQLICVAATGMNNIDLTCAAEKGITVRNVAGYSTNSVAQITFAMILELLVRTGGYNTYIQSGAYSASPIFTHFGRPFWELAGKRFGIIGLGTIGKRVAAIAEAFGAEVCYYSTSGKNLNNPYKHLDINELLRTSDIVSIHAPLNDRTHNLIGASQLRMMKPSALLINVGRGGIVDETALAGAIDANLIAGAGLDVFTQEPLPSGHILLTVRNKDKLLLLPHIAWASIEARTVLISRIAENIKNFQKNKQNQRSFVKGNS